MEKVKTRDPVDEMQSALDRLVETLRFPEGTTENELEMALSIYENVISSSERPMLVRAMYQTHWGSTGLVLMIATFIRHLESKLGMNKSDVVRAIIEKRTIVGLVM